MPIMEHELVIMISRKGFPQLLKSPLRSRMFSDIEVKQTSRSDLKGNEYIKDAEACGHRNKEIAGHNLVRMIAEKGRPALVVASVWS